MMESAHQPRTESAQQAGHILKAWKRQDSIAFRKELKRGLDLCCAPETSGLEDEHLELLQTVVTRLNQYPTLHNAEPDVNVRICMDLLLHLAASATASHFTTESEVPTIFRC